MRKAPIKVIVAIGCATTTSLTLLCGSGSASTLNPGKNPAAIKSDDSAAPTIKSLSCGNGIHSVAVIPSKYFNPLTAIPQQLKKNRLPPRPSSVKSYNVWRHAVTSKVDHVLIMGRHRSRRLEVISVLDGTTYKQYQAEYNKGSFQADGHAEWIYERTEVGRHRR